MISVLPFDGKLSTQLVEMPSTGLSVFWLGQAGFILVGGGVRFLIDPYLSDALERKYRGSATPHDRMMLSPIQVDELPAIDAVLVTHQHSDHLDGESLSELAMLQPGCRFLVPRACFGLAVERIKSENIHAMDAGETQNFAGVTVTAIRAAHETLEVTSEGWHRWLGYVVELAGLSILHSGDTVPFDGQVEEIAGLTPDLALLPVNGRSFALAALRIAGNMTIAEAYDLGRKLGCPVVAHHYGMFAINTVDLNEIDRKATADFLRAELGQCYRCTRG